MTAERDFQMNKEPWMAVCLSVLWPGVGQMYADRMFRGIVFAVAELVLGVVGLWQAVAKSGGLLLAVILLVAAGILAIVSYFYAHRCARQSNQTSFEEERKEGKDPWLAVFLSYIIPGVGHMYVRRWVIGILFLIIAIGGAFGLEFAVRSWKNWLGAALFVEILGALYGVFVCYSAYSLSPIKRPVSSNTLKAFFLFLLAMSVLESAAAPLLKGYAVHSFKVPTGAMQPTLMGVIKKEDGSKTTCDHVLCDRLSYFLRKPQRGEIVVFKTDNIPSCPPNTFYVKRLVGLPGDKLSIQPPYVVINGEKLVDPPIFKKIAEGQDGYSPFCLSAGSFPGTLLSSPDDVVELGEDEYIVLGDNTRNSKDSRYFGPVPGKNIFGRVTKIYWPLNRIGVVE